MLISVEERRQSNVIRGERGNRVTVTISGTNVWGHDVAEMGHIYIDFHWNISGRTLAVLRVNNN